MIICLPLVSRHVYVVTAIMRLGVICFLFALDLLLSELVNNIIQKLFWYSGLHENVAWLYQLVPVLLDVQHT